MFKPRLFLTGIHFKGYKSIEDANITFEKGLNIIIGKNASGKSNFLECLFFALVSRRGSKSSFKFAKLDFLSSDNSFFSWESERELQNIKTEKEKESLEEPLTLKEKLFIDKKKVFDTSIAHDYNKPIEYKKIKLPLRGTVRSIFNRLGFPLYPLYIKFNLPDNLECINIPGTIKIQLEDDFDDWSDINTLNFLHTLFLTVEFSFASDLDRIKNINKKSLLKQLEINDEIRGNLKKYSPIQDIKFNENINIYKDEKTVIIENLKIDFKINNHWIPWSQLSDGTKRLFYIIAEITNQKSGFVLVEEPELGVHPHQFNLIMDFLKEESENKQIIISTHSPQALNHLEEDELSNILITYYDSKKGTQLRHLTPAQIKKAKQYMKEVGFFSDYWMLSDLE